MRRLRLAVFALLVLLVACTGPGPANQSFLGDPGDPDGNLNIDVVPATVSVASTGGTNDDRSAEISLVDPTFTGESPVPLPGLTVTAICKDGWYSYSDERAGTCAGHGGVRDWVNLPPE